MFNALALPGGAQVRSPRGVGGRQARCAAVLQLLLEPMWENRRREAHSKGDRRSHSFTGKCQVVIRVGIPTNIDLAMSGGERLPKSG